MNPVIRRRACVAAVAAVLLSLVACAGGHPGKIAADHSAAAAAGSAMADPTVSNDLNQAENQLLTNLKNNFDPAHPVKSVQAAIKATFPKGDTAKIESYAVQKFTLQVITTHGPGSARDTWAQEVYTYALDQGATPATGTATAPASTPAPPTAGAAA